MQSKHELLIASAVLMAKLSGLPPAQPDFRLGALTNGQVSTGRSRRQGASQAEINIWNAEVDRRKAEKKALKLSRKVKR